jgi:microcystin-dependent protein
MDPFIGQIILFAGNFAPRGWAFCDGQLLPIASNTALFSLVGTTYGGDGRNTFALPDLRGRVPVHVGRGPGLQEWRWGERSGNDTVQLSAQNVPAHTHTLYGVAGLAEEDAPAGNFLGGAEVYAANGSLVAMNPSSIGPSESARIPVPVTQPSLGLYFIIALQGIFPSRG